MQHQAKEADIHALSELKRALDKKVSPPTFYAPKLILFCAVLLENALLSLFI
jgi:hypothetical protein